MGGRRKKGKQGSDQIYKGVALRHKTIHEMLYVVLHVIICCVVRRYGYAKSKSSPFFVAKSFILDCEESAQR